jgi:hypothetical protein
MRDLHINVAGPKDRARQNVSFQIAQHDQRRAIDPQRVNELVEQLRTALAESQIAADDVRRVERRLQAIEDEAASEKPLLDEISSGISFLGQLAQTASGLSPLFGGTLQLLKTAVGA